MNNYCRSLTLSRMMSDVASDLTRPVCAPFRLAKGLMGNYNRRYFADQRSDVQVTQKEKDVEHGRRSQKHRRDSSRNWMTPWGMMPSLFDSRTQRLFDTFANEMMAPFMRPFDWAKEMSEDTPLSPISIDIIESGDKYTIKAGLPGVNKEDVKVSIDRDRDGQQYLAIKAEKKHETRDEDKDKKYVYSESTYGSTQRRVILPDDVDLQKGVDAKLENGELRLELHRNAEKKKHTQEIQIQ